MRRPPALLLIALAAATVSSPPALEATEAAMKGLEAMPTVVARTSGLEERQGLLDLFVDDKHGRVYLAAPPPAPGRRGEIARYLYVEGLLTGLGSNPVGLDRGQISEGRVVALRRVGGRLLIEVKNLRYRALSPDPAERQAVDESFATSVLWAGEIVAQDPDGRALVDFTGFLVRDAHGVAAKLKATGQGSFKLDLERSAADLDAVKVFPENVELQALLTFGSAEPGPLVRRTAPAPTSVTLVEHQSLLRLPPPGYRPRPWDPRAGSFAVTFRDYATPLAQPVIRRWIVRHRLKKTDPTAASSTVERPLVYYVDSGAPEPVRSALVEGASWWADAFAAAGLEKAFRVEILPPGVDPLDARYNVIQWVHRATRGWSYGGGVIDPRTGEMVKGMVTLGSQRVRQDRLLFEGLLGVVGIGSGGPRDPVTLSLARLRQLAAHEVGHTLGFAHNFAASTYGRASVMDYPAPLVLVRNEGGSADACLAPGSVETVPAGCQLDLSAAYAVGTGAWDVQAVRYAYSEFPPGSNEGRALEAILEDGDRRGLVFLSDEDTNPPGSANPLAATWDNGKDPVEGLRSAMAVRRIALARFGRGNLAAGRPLAFLEETLAPLYFHHRYELVAAAKVVGGLEYRHLVNLPGETAAPSHPTDAAWQRRALAEILEALSPAELDLPDGILSLLLPRPPGVDVEGELLPGAERPAFDPLGAASSAADLAASALLEPHRAARLVDFHRRNPALPGLEEVEGALVGAAFASPAGEAPRRSEIRRAVQEVVVADLLRLAADRSAPAGVRARTEATLETLRERLTKGEAEAGIEPVERAMRAFLAGEIGRFVGRPRRPSPGPVPAPDAPPGPPIGGASGGGMVLPPPLAGCFRGG